MRRASRWHLYRNYLFLIPLFALVLVYQGAYVAALWQSSGAAGTVSRPFENDKRIVTGIDSTVELSGLRLQDEIRTVNGRDFTGDRVLFQQLNAAKLTHRLTLVVRRDGELKTIVTPVRMAVDSSSGWEQLLRIVIYLMLLVCVLVGIYVAAMVPYDLRAVIVFGLMISTSQMVSLVTWYQFPAHFWGLALGFHTIGIATFGLWLVLFSLNFPRRFAWDIRRPALKWLFLAPMIAWVVLFSLNDLQGYSDFNRVLSLPDADEKGFIAACITAFFFCLGVKTGTTVQPDSLRRLRVLFAGAVVGLTPLGIYVAYVSATRRTEFNQVAFPIVLLVLLLFFIFPLTLAYVVVAERAMNVRMVIRQGIRYALATGGLRLLGSLLVGAPIWGLANLVFGSKMNPTIRVVLFVAAVIALNRLFRKTRARLQTSLDRRFFREAYDADRVLEELSETVLSLVQEKELLDTVSRRISETLHIPQLTVLLSGDGVFRPVYSLGVSHPIEKAILLEQGMTVTLLKESKEPASVYVDRPDNWVHDLPESERSVLSSIRTQLLLPIGAKKKLLGIVSLGPKRSEEPYSTSDIHLLRSVMVQTGLALENSRLSCAIAQEMAQRERLNREIEIAREVQERLFPQQLPVVAGVDYSGACRPALGVGGDYYDFLPLANGDLGIAIGDVSGKGIAAALLMASLQASLRGQAMANNGDLARLMTNVNQLVYDATPVNRYATFFYGQYHRETRVLTYVNAGHNPPFVLRRREEGSVDVIRLDTGGPVVGLLPQVCYQQGTLILAPGDVFIGFTDGVSEAMNWNEEEWGESRLIPAVTAMRDEAAREIIPRVMQEADQFAAGAPQHDDMTLVVMKLSAAA